MCVQINAVLNYLICSFLGDGSVFNFGCTCGCMRVLVVNDIRLLTQYLEITVSFWTISLDYKVDFM